jgi:predicted alpha/beta-hydrolase family hydrolase
MATHRIEVAPGKSVTVRVRTEGALSNVATAPTFLCAHGAGANQDHPFFQALAIGLGAHGVQTITFNFPYTEIGRKAPDPAPVLEQCAARVAQWVREQGIASGIFVAGGKSMGGRIMTQVAARGALPCQGLVLLGYPLHPPGKVDQLRVAHFPKVTVPSLFVQGERDSFGSPAELAPHLKSLAAPAELYPVPAADHSLHVPKRADPPQAEVFNALCTKVAGWISKLGNHRAH